PRSRGCWRRERPDTPPSRTPTAAWSTPIPSATPSASPCGTAAGRSPRRMAATRAAPASGQPDNDPPGDRMGRASIHRQSGDMTTMPLPDTLDAPPSSTEPSPPSERWSVGAWASRIGRFLAYGFVALLLGAVGFSLLIGLLAAGVSSVVVWVGLPILVAGVHVAHGFAGAERALQRAVLGTELPTPEPVRAPSAAGWICAILTALTASLYWLDSLWVLFNFLLALVTFPLALAWTLGAIATIGAPLATLVLDRVLPDVQGDGLGT